MGMFTRYTLLRALRRLHALRVSDPIDEELRGWNWYSPPLKPRAHLGLGVSELVYGVCPTRRDLWLRRVAGVEPRPTRAMAVGSAVHTLFHESARDVARLLASGETPWDAACRLMVSSEKRVRRLLGFNSWASSLYRAFVLAWCSSAAELGSAPWVTEYSVDGSPLGLSRRLRVDAVADAGVVVELKYGSWRESYPVALAGYAMALESYLETPVDYGVVILVDRVEERPRVEIEPVYIDNHLRNEFLQVRDEAIDMLLTRSEPPRPRTCPRECPFREVCRG
ncbi:MAG: type I-A CRISPR-associated protein Cas4/Csa1 [Thermoprotei archaeon]|nr:MAG: type I-A CRISPR-associated protein Cas4/Csa1 [Thermoprotei archaeon]